MRRKKERKRGKERENERKRGRNRERKWERKKENNNKTTQYFPGVTFRVRTGGQKLLAVAQLFLSSLPVPRPEQQISRGMFHRCKCLNPLALGVEGITDLSHLRIWRL